MRPQIPTKEENPNGLHQRYIVTHSEDMPDDPDALYFVLKLNSKDPVHRRACRLAAWAYVDEIRRSMRLPLLPIGDSHSEDMPDDPDALYFVLKINSKDPVHCRACRLAAWQYIDEIRRSNRLPLLPIGDSHVPPPHQRPTKAQLEVASNLEQLLIQTQT